MTVNLKNRKDMMRCGSESIFECDDNHSKKETVTHPICPKHPNNMKFSYF